MDNAKRAELYPFRELVVYVIILVITGGLFALQKPAGRDFLLTNALRTRFVGGGGGGVGGRGAGGERALRRADQRIILPSIY